MTTQPTPTRSPTWGPTTKLIVGLTVVAMAAALMIQFRNIIGPLILAFMLAYLLYPLASLITERVHLPWRTAVNLIYIALLILLSGLFTATGLATAQQLQSLITILERFVADLPSIVADLSTRVIEIGPFIRFDLKQLDFQTATQQALSTIQPMFGQATSLISTFATSAAVTLGWVLFILLISYFLLAESEQVTHDLVKVEIPGYNEDVRNLTAELKNIWNAFFRGQLIIFVIIMIAYTILMSILGMRYAVGIAVLAGLARFVPYAGPLTVWIVMALVAIFQGSNYFGLQPIQYAVLVVALGLLLDQVMDNLVTPRILGQTLGVHPAAVLIAALIATNLIGIIGLVLAAPVLATMNLLGRYILRKMFDMDPWPPSDHVVQPVELPWVRLIRYIRKWQVIAKKRN